MCSLKLSVHKYIDTIPTVWTVLFITYIRLIVVYVQSFNLTPYIKELARIEKYHLLILDDWGIQPLYTGARLAILQLIEDRHGKASTAGTVLKCKF